MKIRALPMTADEAADGIKAAKKAALDQAVCPACYRGLETFGRIIYTIIPEGVAALRAWEAKQ